MLNGRGNVLRQNLNEQWEQRKSLWHSLKCQRCEEINKQPQVSKRFRDLTHVNYCNRETQIGIMRMRLDSWDRAQRINAREFSLVPNAGIDKRRLSEAELCTQIMDIFPNNNLVVAELIYLYELGL